MFNFLLLSTIQKKLTPKSSNGFTLIELLIAAALTLMVVGVTGWALVTVIKTNKVAKAKSELQYDFNRAVEFMAEEIRGADKIDYDLNLAVNAPKFSQKSWMTPVLSLDIAGIPNNIVYYLVDTDASPAKEPWAGKYVLYRWGPDFNNNGNYSTGNPIYAPLVDMVLEKWDTKDISPVDKRQCRQTGGSQSWVRLPKVSDNDLKGFFICVPTAGALRGQQAELHVYGKIQAEGKKNAFLNNNLAYGVATDVFMRSGEVSKVIIPEGNGTNCVALTLPTVAPGSERRTPLILNDCTGEIDTEIINQETGCEAFYTIQAPDGTPKTPDQSLIAEIGAKLANKNNISDANTFSPIASGDRIMFSILGGVCGNTGNVSTLKPYYAKDNLESVAIVGNGTPISDITGKPYGDPETQYLVGLLGGKGLANNGIVTLRSSQFLILMEANYNVQYKNAVGVTLETNNHNLNDMMILVEFKP